MNQELKVLLKGHKRYLGERGGLFGRVSNPGESGRGFDTYLGHVVSSSKDTFTPRKVLVMPRKRWLRPDVTEKLMTGQYFAQPCVCINYVMFAL